MAERFKGPWLAAFGTIKRLANVRGEGGVADPVVAQDLREGIRVRHEAVLDGAVWLVADAGRVARRLDLVQRGHVRRVHPHVCGIRSLDLPS